ncbi:transcriptional regulator [Pasteurella multocida subsp. gallicida str. Anand1_poultry]|nr:transcriptional regulator [Pasteurella multocida subsp. gallicida str. Anand1_poultry]
MDILDKLLAFAQISAGISVKCQLQGDWQLENPHQTGQAIAHIISYGQAYLQHNGKIHQLKQGDIVFFPKIR